jgi:hypothetical protein
MTDKVGVQLSPVEQLEAIRTFKIGDKFNIVAYRGQSRIVAEGMRLCLENTPERFDISPFELDVNDVRLTEEGRLFGQQFPIVYVVSFEATILNFKKEVRR